MKRDGMMNPAIREFLGTVEFIYRYLKSKEYREYVSYMKLKGDTPRFVEKEVSFRGMRFIVPDVASFFSTYEELIRRQIYTFKTKSEVPVILDFGANIGLSLYFFSRQYPSAEIYGYEADSTIFDYLKRNVTQFDNGKIHLINKAVFDRNTRLKFFSEGADGGHLADSDNESGKAIFVDAIDALEVLNEFAHIDMLKIDIEGAERQVVPRIADQLDKVDNIFIEYHSESDKDQCLVDLLGILKMSGFRIYIQPEFCAERPLYEQKANSGFDLQLDVFGRRVCENGGGE